MLLILVNGRDDVWGFGRGYEMRFIGCVLLQRLGTTLDSGGEKCLFQGSAPSGVKNGDAFLIS